MAREDWQYLPQKQFWTSGWGVHVMFPMGAQDTDFELSQQLLEDDNYIAEIKEDGNHYMFAGGRCFGRKPSKNKKEPETLGYPVEKTANVPHLAEFFADYPKLVVVGEMYYPGYKSNTVTKIMGCSPDKAMMRQKQGIFWEMTAETMWREDSENEWSKVDADSLAFMKLELGEIKFMLFDILYDAEGNDLTGYGWAVRREFLEAFWRTHVYQRMYDDVIHLSQVAWGANAKHKMLTKVEAAGGEGIVLKNKTSAYVLDVDFGESPGKKPVKHWYKRKTEITDDVIVLGFVEGKKTDKGGKHVGRVGAIRVGQYVEVPYDTYAEELRRWDHNDRVLSTAAGFKPGSFPFGRPIRVDDSYYTLQEVGTVGSGYDDSERDHMWKNQNEYLHRVIEVKAMERTAKGKFRHARLIQWRDDKAPEQCIYYPVQGVEDAE